jgi:hypothetical protein
MKATKCFPEPDEKKNEEEKTRKLALVFSLVMPKFVIYRSNYYEIVWFAMKMVLIAVNGFIIFGFAW